MNQQLDLSQAMKVLSRVSKQKDEILLSRFAQIENIASQNKQYSKNCLYIFKLSIAKNQIEKKIKARRQILNKNKLIAQLYRSWHKKSSSIDHEFRRQPYNSQCLRRGSSVQWIKRQSQNK